MKHPQEKRGEIFILISALSQAFFPVGAHFGATQMPSIQFLAYITLAGAMVFLPISIFKKELKNLWDKKILWQLSLYTFLVAVLSYGIVLYATAYSSAIETTLLLQSEVIFALIFGALFLHEKISRNKALGAALILFANVLLLIQNDLHLNWANLALFLAPISFVYANSLAKKLQKDGVSWSLILSFRGVIGGLSLLLIASQMETLQVPSFEMLGFILVFGITVFGLGKILWQLALHRLDLSKATALGLSHPVLSLMIAFLWLGEIPNSTQWISIGVAAIGILFLLKTKSRQWAEQAALD